jgi:hypothetical protein
MRILGIVAVVACCTSWLTEVAIAHGNPVDNSISKAVSAKGYTYANPPTTAGTVGAVYVKMKTTSGQLEPALICYLFPAPVTAAPGPNDNAIQPVS